MLENEKNHHNNTREKYTELQNSFEILGKELEAERKGHQRTK